jgi:hypothetical protein
VPDDLLLLDHDFPAELHDAPTWARLLYAQNRLLASRIGQEPNSDGEGGTGLVGDVRKLKRDMNGLMNLKAQGAGFLAALTIFGSLILLGVSHWVQNLIHAAK